MERLAGLSCLMLAGVAAAEGVPQQLWYQGRLLDSSFQPVQGTRSIKFEIFDAAADGTSLWSDSLASVGVVDGFYAVALGSTLAQPFPPTLFDGNTRYLEISVEGTKLSPRQAIGSVPYAMTCNDSRNVSGGAVNASSVSIKGTTVIDSAGRLVGPAASQSGLTEAESAMLSSTVKTGVVQADATASGGRTRFGAGGGTTGPAGRLFGVTASESGGKLANGLTRVSARLKVTNNSSSAVLAQVVCTAKRAGATSWTALGAIDIRPSDFSGSLSWVTYTLVCDWSPDDLDQFIGIDSFALGITDLFFDFFQIQPVIESTTGLVTILGPDLGDVRNDSSKSKAGAWYTVPGRTLSFVKRYPASMLKVTYQDTLGSLSSVYTACEWQILLDSTPIAFFSAADGTRAMGWSMENSAHMAWARAPAGAHTVSIQSRGNGGAWAAAGATSGTTQCLMGWNTTSNFVSVEEIP